MSAAAVLEVVSNPIRSDLELERSIDELARLQRRAAEIEQQAKAVRARVKAALIEGGLRKAQTAAGHSATLVEGSTSHGDRAVAEALLDPETVARIFRVTHSLSVRVK